jgi:hypothetical protein
VGALGAAGHRRARAGEARARAGDGHQRVHAERFVGSEHVQAGGPRAVPDEQTGPARDGGRGCGDLRVGHAQEHDAGLRRRIVSPATERSRDGVAAGAQRGGKRRAHAATADDRNRALHISVQPPPGVPVAFSVGQA